MKLKISAITCALAAGMLALIGSATAGVKFEGNGSVVIRRAADGSGTVTGFLGVIYNGTGTSEYIGCQRFDGGSVYCHAMNESKQFAYCQGSAYLGAGVATLSPDARIQFRFDASGRCTSISVTHASQYQDKQG